MKVIADTSFLSSLAKIDRLELILKFFDIESITIPVQVVRELEEVKVYDQVSEDLLNEVSSKSSETLVDFSDLDYDSGKFGKGEISCIEICWKEDLLLIDDRDAKQLAEDLGKNCYDLPTFLLSCRKKGIIDKQEMKEIIEDLEEEDHYQFADEIEQKLLSEIES